MEMFSHILQLVALSMGVEWPSCMDLDQGAVWLEDYKGRLTDMRLAEEVLQPDAKFRIIREVTTDCRSLFPLMNDFYIARQCMPSM